MADKASVAHSHSVRSDRTQTSQGGPSTLRVITSPPWARDEPPSPTDDPSETNLHTSGEATGPSDVTSHLSSGHGSNSDTRWWAFTLPKNRANEKAPMPPPAPSEAYSPGAASMRERKGISLRERSMSWMPITRKNAEKDQDPEATPIQREQAHMRPWDLQIDLPAPPEAPFTLAQNRTPGWDTPWTPRIGDGGLNGNGSYSPFDGRDRDSDSAKYQSPWAKRRRRMRKFILTNVFVPLLFRFINITFTTAALALAIRIRLLEQRDHITGAVGSSPSLVIIFAPLTLVHVMVAIYLEYFGRPLGLWRTSGKLALTLIEVLFICMWSAALSLCFDNFFTSYIPCASPRSEAWYNKLPRPESPIEDAGALGDRVCDDQLALIILVAIGLIMYCTNLVISLFRIFEKVKLRQ